MNYQTKSQWLTANAGSGKTTALTQRVVRLLLQGVAPEHMVCITYTKAAANEMRHRVLDMLRALLLEEDAATAARIEKLMGAVPTDAQLAHARSLFGRVLDSPNGGLHITTIHGFCQHLLRRFPMEAGIAPHFTVLDDTASDDALRTAKHAVLTGLQSADAWLRDAVALIGARGGESRFESLAADIIAKRTAWEAIWHLQSCESLRAHLFAFHQVEEGATRESLAAWFCQYVDGARTAVIRDYLPALLAHKTASYRNFGEGLSSWLASDNAGRVQGLDACITLFIKQDGERRARLLNDKEYPLGHPLRDTVEALAEAALRYTTQLQSLACAEESFAVAVLARALRDIYAQVKATQHALDYDDLIAHTLALVSQPETLGWVMSKLDHRIDHLLIDEAQDNSRAQWELARILVEELIANNDGVGHANLPRSVLVVGDEKQSIYSFQGAAPEEFQRYRKIFAQMLEGSPSPLEEGSLDYSYRSSPAVLKLVDHLCAQPVIAAAINASGACQEHRVVRADACGRVAVYPPTMAHEDEGAEALTLPTEYHLQASAPNLLAEQIAATIDGWLRVEKRMLVSENRPLNAGDILILVKNRNPLVQPLIRALQRRNVAVAGLDRLMLADHLAVRDLLALMAWCVNMADDLALAQVLRSPLMGMSDEQLRAAAYGRPGTLWQQVDAPWLAQMLQWKDATPYDFLTQVLEVSNRRQDFARRFGEEVHEVLDELKAQAAAMPTTKQPTLAEFHAWIEGSTRSIKREQETGGGDMVRIMTVHGAKGLEAPVVILADTVSVPTTQRERLFVARSAHGQPLPVIAISPMAKNANVLAAAKQQKLNQIMDEYYRLLYVALTRARDELHVFGMANAKGVVKDASWYAVVAQSVRALGVEEAGVLLMQDAAPANPKAAAQPKPHVAQPPLPSWARTAPVLDVVAAVLSPSGFAQTQAQPSRYVQQSAGAAKERGVRIHRVLELLRAESTMGTIGQLVRHVAPDWSAAEKEKAIQEIAALHAQESWIWQHSNRVEVNVAGIVGDGLAMSGQIDMLVDTPDALVILDYKTGAHVPRAEEVSENYLLQLKTYRELIQQIYPTRRVRCAILWTHGPQLMWLDEAVERAQFPLAMGA